MSTPPTSSPSTTAITLLLTSVPLLRTSTIPLSPWWSIIRSPISISPLPTTFLAS